MYLGLGGSPHYLYQQAMNLYKFEGPRFMYTYADGLAHSQNQAGYHGSRYVLRIEVSKIPDIQYQKRNLRLVREVATCRLYLWNLLYLIRVVHLPTHISFETGIIHKNHVLVCRF